MRHLHTPDLHVSLLVSASVSSALRGSLLFVPVALLTAARVDKRHQARYYKTKDPQFHQDAYAVLTATVVFSNMWIMERILRPALKRREESRRRVRTPRLPTTNEVIKQMWVMVATGKQLALIMLWR